jgi:periplasmic protein CpxP/Spy
MKIQLITTKEMNRTKLLTIVIVCLLLLNFGTLGILFFSKPGGPPHGGMGPGHGGPKMIIIERLHFDETQQKQYESLIEEHHSKTNELRDASGKLHKELYSLLVEAAPDKAKADSLVIQISENQKAMDYLNFDHFQKIRSICRPEQIKDFNILARDLSELFGPKGPPPTPGH